MLAARESVAVTWRFAFCRDRKFRMADWQSSILNCLSLLCAGHLDHPAPPQGMVEVGTMHSPNM
jgi:hypothetical protein